MTDRNPKLLAQDTVNLANAAMRVADAMPDDKHAQQVAHVSCRLAVDALNMRHGADDHGQDEFALLAHAYQRRERIIHAKGTIERAGYALALLESEEARGAGIRDRFNQ